MATEGTIAFARWDTLWQVRTPGLGDATRVRHWLSSKAAPGSSSPGANSRMPVAGLRVASEQTHARQIFGASRPNRQRGGGCSALSEPDGGQQSVAGAATSGMVASAQREGGDLHRDAGALWRWRELASVGTGGKFATFQDGPNPGVEDSYSQGNITVVRYSFQAGPKVFNSSASSSGEKCLEER